MRRKKGQEGLEKEGGGSVSPDQLKVAIKIRLARKSLPTVDVLTLLSQLSIERFIEL